MKNLIIIIITLISSISFSQEKEQLLALKKANSYVYEGNALVESDDFVSAEMEYRKAISEQPTTVSGIYNLGNSYYKKGNFEEALYRHQQAAETASSKSEKHKAFHNIGNILMQNKKCKEAVEAFKNALRNDPTDDETRYNYALAKECAEQQKEDQQDENKDDENKDKNEDNKDNEDKKDNKDKEGENEDENKDKDDQDKKEGEDEKDDEGKPKDEKEDKGKGDEEKKDQQKPKPQPGQLSPQQIKNLLEAMNNQEQKVQAKMNEEKQKGVKIKTEKDW